jgi:phosphate transport system substrate-binding protein
MNRRRFLQMTGILAGGFGIGYAASAVARSSRTTTAVGGHCYTPGARPWRTALQPGVLSYQGTHILTYGALKDLGEAYTRHSGRPTAIHGGGCDDGIAAVQRGETHLGGLCCPVEGSRAEGLPTLLLARDLKVVVAHPETPVDDLSLDALRAIARGKIRRWDAVGGTARPIALVVRKHCPDYFEPVRHLLLDNRPEWSPQGLFVDTDLDLLDMVARFEGSLGLVSWVFAEPLVQQGRLKLLAIDGVPATLDAAASDLYPLTGPLNLIYRDWDEPTMRPFLDFAYSPIGRLVIARRLIPVDATANGYRPRQA